MTVPTLRSSINYRDQRAAIAFLQEAFGFEVAFLAEEASGAIAHCRLSFDDGEVMVSGEWSDEQMSPISNAGLNTQNVCVQLRSGIEQHFERARVAGAKVIIDLQDRWYGERVYGCLDPEGHLWNFSQTLHDLTPAIAAAHGTTIRSDV